MDYATHNTYRLTFRQIEFCRHYALGHSCREAARRAGYSEAFIDKKCHLLLRHPGLAFKIREMQHASTFIAQHQFGAAVAELYDILTDSPNEKARFLAAKEIARLYLKQPILPNLLLEGAEIPETEEEHEAQGPEFEEAIRIEKEATRVENLRAENTRVAGSRIQAAIQKQPDPTDDLKRIEDTRPKKQLGLSEGKKPKQLGVGRRPPIPT